MKKNEIFIASRFEEFKELRRILKEKIDNYSYLEAIDLNNNEASHRSPLMESLFFVKKSQVMLLLLGETYGTIPKGSKLSYTHLEYREAIKESSNTRVLVFCIGESYSGTEISYSNDKKLNNWQIELENNHRLKKFDDKNDINLIAEKILIDLQSSLYDLNITNSEENNSDLELGISDLEEDFLENSEVSFLDNKSNDIEEIGLMEDNEKVEGFELLKIPNKLASIEQKKEAQYAIDIKDYSSAIKHLKKSLELRPLDFETNYWLAKLYITSAKKSLFYEIEEHLLRAAKIAESQNSIYKASHCYQLIVQASIFSDKKNEGLKYIGLAQELTPSFSRLFYEKAKFLFHNNMFDEARKALMETINIKMDSIELIDNDPFFKNYEEYIDKIFINLKSSLYKITEAILYETNNIRRLFSYKKIEINLVDNSLIDLWKKSRYGIINQYKALTYNIKRTDINEIQILKNKILEVNEMLEKEKKEEENKYKKKINNIMDERNITIADFENKQNGQDRNYNLLILVCILVAVIFNISTNKIPELYEILPYVLIGIIICLSILIFFKVKNKKSNQDLGNKVKENYEKRERELYNELEKQILNFEDKVKKTVEEYELEIKYITDSYSRIKKAFLIFENKSITITSYKFIPFKSLKKAYKGNIIRVTKKSFEAIREEGVSIVIKEDLPNYLNIPIVNLDQSSFLAKVISRKPTEIILSRVGAYIENITIDKSEEKELKINNKINYFISSNS